MCLVIAVIFMGLRGWNKWGKVLNSLNGGEGVWRGPFIMEEVGPSRRHS